MSTSPIRDTVHAASARVAITTRWGTPAAVAEARQELTAAKLERSIREALAATPPLSAHRRAELVQLLQGGEHA